MIDQQYLPPQCVEHISCNSVAVDTEWLALPSNSSLVFINLASPDKWQVVPIGHDCNPTNLFFNEGTLWVACVKSTDYSSRLTYLPYLISKAVDGLDIEYLLDPQNSAPSQVLNSSFSRSIFIHHPSCFSHGESNLYTVADGYVWHFPLSSGADMVFTRSEIPLENCSSIAYIDSSSGTTFTVHCNGGVATTYDTCSGQWQYHPIREGGLYFPCSSLIETVFTDDSIRVTYTNGTIIWHKNHSVGDILHGECKANVFNAVAVNGSLYAFVFRLGSFYLVAQNVCDAGSCFWPTFDSDTSRFIGIDKGNATLFSVSEVVACSFPVKDIHVNSIPYPAMIHYVSTPGHICQCSYAGFSPSGSESSTSQTTIADINITITSSIEVDVPSRALSLSIPLGLGIGIPVGVLVVVIIAITILLL